MAPEKPRRLGRGLEALLASRGAGEATTATPDAPVETSALRTIAIGQIRPTPFQPRQEFKPEDLADLEASLRATGLLQPITVRPAPAGQGFELIAGERRYRAATRIGWTEIPAIVKEIDDQTLLTLALVENLQRADLNPIEEAEGYQRLIAEFALTQQQVADLVGKDRTTITNALRVLTLPAAVRRMIQDGQITQGHARALLVLGSERAMSDMAREIITDGLSVREVERRARESTEKAPRAGKTRTESPDAPFKTAEVRRIEDRLRRHFQTDVQIALSDKQKGEIRLAFYNADDFERLLDALGTRPE
jgi:ParB family transcriptional regulator, chromosome partitioning protein